MHIDDITAALARRDVATIKEALAALANYPKEGPVAGLAAGNAMIFLEAAADALRADYSIMPRDTCAAFGLAQGASYAEGAAAVLDNRQTWSEHFGMILRAQ
jgi:hypothetical protein